MFGPKNKSPLIITAADDLRAAEENKPKILHALATASDSAFVQFLDDNGVDVTKITLKNVEAYRENVIQDYRGMKPESFAALNTDAILHPSRLLTGERQAEKAVREEKEERRGDTLDTLSTVLYSCGIAAGVTGLVLSAYSVLKDPPAAEGPKIEPTVAADFHGAIKADGSSTEPATKIVTAQAAAPAPMPRPAGLD